MSAEVWTVVSTATGNELRFRLAPNDLRRDVLSQQALRGELVITDRARA